MAARMTDPKTHSLLEDAQGLAFGATMASLGIVILTQLGMITGQTAGLAVLIAGQDGGVWQSTAMSALLEPVPS